MSRNLVLPFFPNAPQQYDSAYMSEVTRAFAVYLNQMQNPGEGRNTELVLSNLQTDDFNLELGSLFQVDGSVKITIANKPHARSQVATGAVGTVTVTT